MTGLISTGYLVEVLAHNKQQQLLIWLVKFSMLKVDHLIIIMFT